ncbi:MAG: DoxX family protein [Jatrophihabitans sp.]
MARTTRRPRSSSSDPFEAARLILRAAIGATFVAHGMKHATSLDGTAGWFESIGFAQPRLQAQLSSAVEVGSGAALLAGAATPLSAAAVVGTMSVAIRTVHLTNGFFITAEGWEYAGFLSAASVALAALGSGRYSVDRVLGVDRLGTPTKRAALTAGVGLAGAAIQLKTFWRKPSR